MDPFGRLPWFVLQIILSNLPDLVSLHSLHNASPEVAALFHSDNALFARIVDAIIRDPACERGLLLHVQSEVRLLVLIWTQVSSQSQPRQGNGKAAEPLEESRKDILSTVQCVRERHLHGFYKESPILKAISQSTPSTILCRLLSLMTSLRRIAHACFHSMIARCLKLRVEHSPKKTRYRVTSRVTDPSQRPPGIPYVPFDIGPPTWIEEQRLLKCSVISEDGQPIQVSLDNNVEGFWMKIVDKYNDGQVEQITTLAHWLDEQAGIGEKVYSWLVLSGGALEDYDHCCRHYTSMPDEQWDEEESNMGGRSS